MAQTAFADDSTSKPAAAWLTVAGPTDLFSQAHQPTELPSEQHRTILNQAVHSAIGMVWHDENSKARAEIENYTTQFATAVPLFVGGTRGYVASAILFGANQAKWGDDKLNMAEDAVLGAAKGLLTKKTFEVFGASKELSVVSKGLWMGTSSRFLDMSLTRQTYAGDTLGGGLAKSAWLSVEPGALATDVVVFGAAHLGVKLGDFATGGALKASEFATNALTGTTFGFASGATSELQRQVAKREDFSLLKILERGGAEAGTMTLAASAGYGLTIKAELPAVVQQQREGANVWKSIGSRFGKVADFIIGEPKPGLVFGSGDGKGTSGELNRAGTDLTGTPVPSTGTDATAPKVTPTGTDATGPKAAPTAEVRPADAKTAVVADPAGAETVITRPTHTQAEVQRGVDLLGKALAGGAGSAEEAEFFRYAREGGKDMKDDLMLVARETNVENQLMDLLHYAYGKERPQVSPQPAPHETLSVPVGMEGQATEGLRLLQNVAANPTYENVTALNRFVVSPVGTALSDVMLKAAEAIAKAQGKPELLDRVQRAYTVVEVKYNGPPELESLWREADRLYKQTMTPDHAQAEQQLIELAQGAGKNLEYQMTELARLREGDAGAKYMRERIYHGNDKRIVVADTGADVFVTPQQYDRAVELIGTAQAASDPASKASQWLYNFLSHAAQAAAPEARSAMLEYAEKSGDQVLLHTVRDCLMPAADLQINLDPVRAGRFQEFLTAVRTRPPLTNEGITQYQKQITDWLGQNPDMGVFVQQLAPHLESSAAVGAIDAFLGTNNLSRFPVSNIKLAELRAQAIAQPEVAQAAPRGDYQPLRPDQSVMSAPIDQLISAMHNAPERLKQEQAAVGAQGRIGEMTDGQFAQYLQWLYAEGPNGRWNMNSIQFPNRSVLERPEVIASLTGEPVGGQQPVFTIEALRRYLTMTPDGSPPLPNWLETFVARHSTAAESKPLANWLLSDINRRFLLPRNGAQSPAAAQVPESIRQLVVADAIAQANRPERPAQPGQRPRKQFAPEAEKPESISTRLAALGALLDAKTPDAVNLMMRLGAQDGRVLNDVVTRLSRFAQKPEVRPLLQNVLPQADNIYTLQIMLRSLEDASGLARRNPDAAAASKKLADAAADQMMPGDARAQQQVTRIIDLIASGKIELPRPPRKMFDKPGAPARPVETPPPSVPFFSNSPAPVEGLRAGGNNSGVETNLARNAGTVADPVSTAQGGNDGTARNAGAENLGVHAGDLFNPDVVQGSAKVNPRPFDASLRGYSDVLANLGSSPEAAVDYSAYVSKYFDSVLSQNMPKDNLKIVVPDGGGLDPMLRIVMRPSTPGAPAVVYEGRIALEPEATAAARAASDAAQSPLQRPIGILVADAGGKLRLVKPSELCVAAKQVADGTYPYPQAADQAATAVAEVPKVSDPAVNSLIEHPLPKEAGAADWIGEDKYDHQEDSHWVSADGNVAVVADGIGGSSNGATASRITTDVLSQLYKTTFPQGGSEEQVSQWLYDSLLTASREVRKARGSQYVTSDGQILDGGSDMGAAVVASVRVGDKMYMAWAGDSRAYRLRDGKLQQLTTDHEDADGALSQYMGRGDLQLGRLVCKEIRPGDRFLIATDGLQKMPEDTVRNVLSQSPTAQEASNNLIAAVKADYAQSGRHGQDNVSVVVLDPPVQSPAPSRAQSPVAAAPEVTTVPTPVAQPPAEQTLAASTTVAPGSDATAAPRLDQPATAAIEPAPLAELKVLSATAAAALEEATKLSTGAVATLDAIKANGSGEFRSTDAKIRDPLGRKDQIIKHNLKELKRLGYLEMNGDAYKPTAKYRDLVRAQAEAKKIAAASGTSSGGSSAGTDQANPS